MDVKVTTVTLAVGRDPAAGRLGHREGCELSSQTVMYMT